MANATSITIATFGIAPGGFQSVVDQYMAQYGGAGLANALVGLLGKSNYDLASSVTDNLLGNVATTQQKMLVRDYLYQELNKGTNAGQLIDSLVDIVDSLPNNDPTWGKVATRFDNCKAVAEYYATKAGTQGSTDIATLRQYVSLVDDSTSILQQFKTTIDQAFPASTTDDHVGDGTTMHTVLDADLSALQSLVSLNSATGVLSTASLRAAIVAETGQTAYDRAFTPSTYGNGDATLTAEELGFSSLGNLPATEETVESLFYGTTITALKSIDMNEITQLSSYVQSHQAQLQSGELPQGFIDLMVSIYTTPAAAPIFNDAIIAQTITAVGIVMVQTVASGDSTLPLDMLGHLGF